MESPVPESTTALLAQLALPAIPLAFLAALLGLVADSWALTASGLCAAALAAVVWTGRA